MKVTRWKTRKAQRTVSIKKDTHNGGKLGCDCCLRLSFEKLATRTVNGWWWDGVGRTRQQANPLWSWFLIIERNGNLWKHFAHRVSNVPLISPFSVGSVGLCTDWVDSTLSSHTIIIYVITFLPFDIEMPPLRWIFVLIKKNKRQRVRKKKPRSFISLHSSIYNFSNKNST